jgi:hypothetical protein
MDPQTLMIAALAGLASAVPVWGLGVWFLRRDRRHQHQAQAHQRRWALQRQLWDLERQIRGDEETRRLTRIEALIDDGVGGINRRLDDIEVMRDRMLGTRVLAWSVVGLSLDIIMGFGLILWWR